MRFRAHKPLPCEGTVTRAEGLCRKEVSTLVFLETLGSLPLELGPFALELIEDVSEA